MTKAATYLNRRQVTDTVSARPILRFDEKFDSLLVSGLLVGGDELTGKAVAPDAPLGSGHMVLSGSDRWEVGIKGGARLAQKPIGNWDPFTARVLSRQMTE